METNSNTTMANLLLAATLSTSVVSLSYGMNENFIPKDDHFIDVKHEIADWTETAFNNTPYYIFQTNQFSNYKQIIDFSQKLISNSKNLDSEFIDIVNENFWDLI